MSIAINITLQVILIVFFSFLNQNITQQSPFSGQVFQETYRKGHVLWYFTPILGWPSEIPPKKAICKCFSFLQMFLQNLEKFWSLPSKKEKLLREKFCYV